MKRLAATLGLALLAAHGDAAAPLPILAPAIDASPPAALIERGHYLATAADCAPCHVGPEGEPFAGGRPLATPLGKIVASNVTPDAETGIGSWTEEEFVRAVREGIGRGGEHLYPAMPYPYYTRLRREDVLAIRAYLMTQPPVRHAVEENRLPFPFRVRSFVAIWNALYFRAGEFADRRDQSAQWNRGAYLTEGLGHCGACHTPKNRLGGEDKARGLDGGMLEGWFSPNLRDDRRTGLGTWSVDGIVEYLKAGNNAWAAATGPMAEVISQSTSKLSDADLLAISVYLKTRTALDGSVGPPVATDAATAARGRTIYLDSCSSCHGPDGLGVPRLFPPLKGSPVVQSDNPATLIRVVLHGAQNAATDPAPTAPAMPSFGWMLADSEVAAVLSYIRTGWGNSATAVSPTAVRAGRLASEK